MGPNFLKNKETEFPLLIYKIRNQVCKILSYGSSSLCNNSQKNFNICHNFIEQKYVKYNKLFQIVEFEFPSLYYYKISRIYLNYILFNE